MRLIRWVKPIKLLLIGLALLVLSGCWDRLEIDERAVVLGISVDTAELKEEEHEEDVSHLKGAYPVPEGKMVRVSAQIALPGKIPLGPGDAGGSSESDAPNTVWVIGVVGHTIDDALMNLQQQISGRLFFGHLRVIVVSEEYARNGMQTLNDYMHRNSEVRRMAWILVAKGNAEALMKAKPKLERAPAMYLMSTMDEAVRQGKFPKDYIGMFWSDSMKKGQEGFLPYVEMMREGNIQLSGIAYFVSDKMVGATKPFEIAGYMSVKGLNPGGYRGVVKLGSGDSVMIYGTSRDSKLQVEIRKGRPHFTVHIHTEINVEEKAFKHEFQINHSELLTKIEEENAKSLKTLCENLIRNTQEQGSDIFGFGEYVRAKEPKYWNKEIKTNEGWQDMYKEMTFDIKVSTNVRRVGMKAE